MPIFWGGIDLTIPELKWLVIGEKLASGHLLYKELWDNTGPFSALVYGVLSGLFGKSQLALHIFNILLLTYQCYLFNNLFIENKAFKDNTYLPAFIYALFMSLSFDFYSLAPIFMAQTFVLLATKILFKRVGVKTNDEAFHNIGFYLGIASLFYLPSAFFFLSTIISLLIFTRTIGRRYLLCLYGFLIPIILTGLFFYWRNAETEFVVQYFSSWLILESQWYYTKALIFALMLLPTLFVLLGVSKLFRARGFVNYQVTLQQAVFVMSIASFLGWLISMERAPYQLMIFAIPGSFFVSHYFLLLKRSISTELIFMVFVALVLFVNISLFNDADYVPKNLNYDKLLVQESKLKIRGKKVLNLSTSIEDYRFASLATPYLNWQLTKNQIAKPQYFDNITSIQKNFNSDLPEVIIDREGFMIKIFDYLPELKAKYVETNEKGLYVLRESGF